jgi:hypothetical protein
MEGLTTDYFIDDYQVGSLPQENAVITAIKEANKRREVALDGKGKKEKLEVVVGEVQRHMEDMDT